jgi:ribose transport system permease protein
MAIVILAICFVITYIILNKTPFGRYVYAVGGNSKAAEASGINPKKITRIAYLMDGLLTGIASILLMSRLNSGVPGAGLTYEMDAITAVVVGGTSMSGGSGKLGGTLIGVLIIGILNNGLNLMGVNSDWQYIIKGAVILLAVYTDFLRNRKKAG